MGMLRDVIGAAERAAQLTRQLLAYAGKAENASSPTDVSAFVRELGALLRTSIPKLVQVAFELDDQLPPVMVDPAQLQQVVMNLVINAAEAIPDGTPGTVTVSTTVRSLQPEDSRTAVIPIDQAAPEYVAMTVRDTGAGMDIATQARIFDPFYTTKFAGRGLGLSAVLGIVRGYRGTVTLTSAPGQGTTFTVLLPAERGAVVADEATKAKVTVKGHGKILIVDDEGLVLNVARRALEHHGYEVIVAGDGVYAIEQVRKHPELRAVLLDMAMPEMGGDAAAVEIRALRPDLPIVLCSGYAERDARQRTSGTPFSTFLQKPYSIGALIEKMASVLTQ
jgi:CheY-like chemotaxis protein